MAAAAGAPAAGAAAAGQAPVLLRNDENNPSVSNVAANQTEGGTGIASNVTPVQRYCERYWEIKESSNEEHRKLILRMFAPGSGLLSKGKDAQWKHIQENLLVGLTQLSFDAKDEELRRRLIAIEKELSELNEGDDEDEVEDSNGDVNEDANEIHT